MNIRKLITMPKILKYFNLSFFTKLIILHINPDTQLIFVTSKSQSGPWGNLSSGFTSDGIELYRHINRKIVNIEKMKDNLENKDLYISKNS